MDEYLRGSMYDFPGINVDVAPAAGEDSTTNPASPAPSVLNPVGTGGGGASSPFTSYSVATGLPSFGYEDIDPVDFISKFEKTSPKAKGRSDDSFLKFGINQLDPKNIPLGVASLAIPGAAAFGIAAAELNRRSQKKTADAIMATGKTGGSMYTFQGQTVHRLPGTKQFNGTLGNMTSAEHYRFDEIRRGFIPGTMVETKSRVGSLDAAMGQSNEYIRTGKNTIAYDAGFGAGMDAFGTVHSASGPQGGSASAATALREQLYRENMNRLGLTIDESRVASEALSMKQALDAGMRNSQYHGGFTHKASNLSDEDYAAAQTLSQQIIQRHLNANTQSGRAAGAARQAEADKKAAEATQRIKEQEAQRQATLQQYDEEDDGGSYGGGRDFSVSTAQQTAGDRYQAMADRGYSGYPFADGGRVGMQMGGTAPQTAPAGFVERPPSQVSEAATVADDKPMSVPEGTFVINAAAVEFAGEGDIAKMLKDAYAKAGKQGSAAPSKEQIDVAVSRGEVIVPPAIAKIIGYDRLEKINNRGKKETKDRIKENGQGRKGAAGGGFLTRKKLANGGEAQDIYEDKIIIDEVRRKMDDLLKNLPDDVKVDSRYYGDDYPARRDFHRQLAILNDADPDAFNMRAFASEERGLINVPQTPTLFNLYAMAEEIAHLEASRYRRPETETVKTLRADEQSLFASIPGTEGDMRKHYGAYEQGGFLYTPSQIASMSDKEKAEIQDTYGVPADKVRNTFSYPDYFELEQDYLEEIRAKSIAFQTVFGKLDKTSSKNVKENTKTGRAIDLAESSYGENFAKYILATASPTLQIAIFHKHPELRERYFDDQGRFKKRNIQPDADFRMVMVAEDEEARKRSLKEFKEADDRNIVVKNLTSPRKSTFIEGYGRIPASE
jgi:hypothetical protein